MKIGPRDGNTSLKELLTARGWHFPCGGKGLCGRCRILAPDLNPTALDRRFFGESDLSKGLRLACDKTLDKDIEIECYLPLAPRTSKVEDPQIAAVLRREGIELAIVGDEEVERTVLPFPEESLTGLRAAVGKNSVEFFEKYKAAKAVTILVAGEPSLTAVFAGDTPLPQKGEVYPASLFDMPSETVYLPPVPNGSTGSDALLELLEAEENTLTVFPGQGLFLYKGESVFAASVGAPGGVLWERAFIAAAKYFIGAYAPEGVYLIGKGSPEAQGLLKDSGIAAEKRLSTALSAAAEALTDNRYRTRLDKLARRTELINLAETEEWQRLFSE